MKRSQEVRREKSLSNSIRDELVPIVPMMSSFFRTVLMHLRGAKNFVDRLLQSPFHVLVICDQRSILTVTPRGVAGDVAAHPRRSLMKVMRGIGSVQFVVYRLDLGVGVGGLGMSGPTARGAHVDQGPGVHSARRQRKSVSVGITMVAMGIVVDVVVVVSLSRDGPAAPQRARLILAQVALARREEMGREAVTGGPGMKVVISPLEEKGRKDGHLIRHGFVCFFVRFMECVRRG